MSAICFLTLIAVAFGKYKLLLDLYAEEFVFPNTIRPSEFSAVTIKDDTFRTSDGVTLGADIHRPKGIVKAPTILVRIPLPGNFSNKIRSDIIGRFWARRGYVVVVQGTRGRYRSEGDFYPAINEARDGFETLQWLQGQPWFDGRLAMWGGSSFGHTQWAVSEANDLSPDVHAIQITSTDYYNTFYSGGAFALESALYWALISPPKADRATSSDEIETGANGWPLIEADNRGFQNVEFFDDWVNHQLQDDYWRQIDGRGRARNIDAPILLLGGWFDPFLQTMLKDFEVLTTENPSLKAVESRLIVGPYGHATEIMIAGRRINEHYRMASIEPVVRWFDHWLGYGEGGNIGSKVRIYVMGENTWRDEQEWPLERTVYTPYYLTDTRLLTTSPPVSDFPAIEYDYDPENPVATSGGAMLGPRSGMKRQIPSNARNDVLSFLSDALETDLEVTGPISAILHVATDRSNTDFTVKLVDVHPDGTAYNITDGILRQDYGLNILTEITVTLPATSYLFKKGHRMRIDVSSSNFPKFDRNTNTGRNPADETEFLVAHQKLFVSLDRASQVILPIIPR